MSRLGAAFAASRDAHRPALVTYLMAGDPDLGATEALAEACERGGADVLELGIPFSDPIADGPEIQRAGQRALKTGTRPRDVLALVERLRPRLRIPIVLMTYMNPVLALGLSTFAERAVRAGADGVIVPDLSLEESGEVRAAFDSEGLDLIQLVAPSTSEGRAAAVARASRGFLYVVARYGTTGTRESLPRDLGARLASLHRVTNLPLAVGFGVSTPDHVASLAEAGADGVVVGSAIVQKAAEAGSPAAVERFVAELAGGLGTALHPPARRGHVA